MDEIRPLEEYTTTICCQIVVSAAHELDRRAIAQGKTRSALLREIIEQYLLKIEEEG